MLHLLNHAVLTAPGRTYCTMLYLLNHGVSIEPQHTYCAQMAVLGSLSTLLGAGPGSSESWFMAQIRFQSLGLGSPLLQLRCCKTPC